MKKIGSFIFAVLLGIVMVLGVAGCKSAVPPGFYTLQEAYDLGLLTKSDLKTIAHYVNTAEDYPETLDPQTEKAIKEWEAEYWRSCESHPIPEATAEDFTIEKYLGTYSGVYVVEMDNIYIRYPLDIRDYSIGGVEFYDGSFYIRVWKLDT